MPPAHHGLLYGNNFIIILSRIFFLLNACAPESAKPLNLSNICYFHFGLENIYYKQITFILIDSYTMRRLFGCFVLFLDFFFLTNILKRYHQPIAVVLPPIDTYNIPSTFIRNASPI